MTREEALKEIEIDYDIEGYEVPNESMTSFTDTVNLISMIYKDFENRTCENCKHMDLLNTDEYACSSDFMIVQFNTYPQYPLVVESDFGCNKWETK